MHTITFNLFATEKEKIIPEFHEMKLYLCRSLASSLICLGFMVVFTESKSRNYDPPNAIK